MYTSPERLVMQEATLQVRQKYARVGLHRVTVSLDTLDAGRFRRLTRRDLHARVLAGIEAARRVGFPGP